MPLVVSIIADHRISATKLGEAAKRSLAAAIDYSTRHTLSADELIALHKGGTPGVFEPQAHELQSVVRMAAIKRGRLSMTEKHALRAATFTLDYVSGGAA